MKAPADLSEFVRHYANDELHLRLPDWECPHGFLRSDEHATCECWKKAL